jgi:tetratricopeptide (TPR) repeat protein
MIAVDYKSWKSQSSLETLKTFAIEAALICDWAEATKINQKIVTLAQNDVEALNRLARAQACSNQPVKAFKTYKKVLEIDPYNIIARKNSEKLSKIEKNPTGTSQAAFVPNGQTLRSTTQKLSDIFLFEPGKTKIINLLNLAPPFVLARLSCGDKAAFNLKKHGICVTGLDGAYLGALPDDLAHKLLYYIEGGNEYEVYVKIATTKNLTVFIREVARSEKFAHQPSFLTDSNHEEKAMAFA